MIPLAISSVLFCFILIGVVAFCLVEPRLAAGGFWFLLFRLGFLV